MKVKNIEIKIESLEEFFKNTKKEINKINTGKFARKLIASTSFESLQDLRKTLTPKRMQLLHLIKYRKPNSVYELAKISCRPRRAIIHDLNILTQIGLLELKKEYKHDERIMVKPILKFEKINIGISL